MRTTDTSGTSGTSGTSKLTTSFTVRLPTELVIRMGVLAVKERKSRQQWIEEALRLVVEHNEQANA